MVIVFDPKAYWLAIVAASHSSNRESVTTWLGASNRLLTSGFYLVIFINKRNLFIVCWFIPFEYLSLHLYRQELPLVDADTQIIFMAGKDDNTVGFQEVSERDPIIARFEVLQPLT
jgi:hypothetical protein